MINKARGREMFELIKEIEEAYADVFDHLKNEKEEKEFLANLDAMQYVNEYIEEFKNDAKFINSFNSYIEKAAVIKTLQYLRNYEREKINKTHSHKNVLKEIEKAKSMYPEFKVKQIIEHVANKLNMTPRAVQHHYYNPR